jgi:hypothetical protein
VSSEVRLYRPEDRAAVREIAWRTGFIGESPEWYWRDRQSFEEIWTPYYTDQEPESLLVATRDEQVVGYLTGCVDTAHAPSPKQAVLRQLLRRALLFRPGTAAFFWRAIERGVAFFTRMGFRPYGDPVLAPGMRMPDGGPLHMQLMVIDLHHEGDQALSIE